MISDLAISRIKGNNIIMGKLMVAFNKGERAMQNWLERKDIKLTTVTAINIIKAETGLTEEEILVDDKATA